MFAFQTLQLHFVFYPLLGRQPIYVGPPGIGNPERHRQPGRQQHVAQALKGGVRACGGRIRTPRPSLSRPPQPTKASGAIASCPRTITSRRRRRVDSTLVNPCTPDVRADAGSTVRSFFSWAMTVCGLMPSTRAVSRMPLPLSTSCSFYRLCPPDSLYGYTADESADGRPSSGSPAVHRPCGHAGKRPRVGGNADTQQLRKP